jgi:hypothetical protein
VPVHHLTSLIALKAGHGPSRWRTIFESLLR